MRKCENAKMRKCKNAKMRSCCKKREKIEIDGSINVMSIHIEELVVPCYLGCQPAIQPGTCYSSTDFQPLASIGEVGYGIAEGTNCLNDTGHYY